MNSSHWKKDIYTETQRVVTNWFREQCQDTALRFYVYYLPGQIKFRIATESPGSAWVKGMPDKLSIGWTIEQTQYQINDSASRWPIFTI